MKNNTNIKSLDLKSQATRVLLMMTLSIFLMSFTTTSLFAGNPAQQSTVTGKVTDSFTGKPIAGVSVTIKGTKTVALTKADGTYSINLPKSAKILVFTLSGYQNLEVAVAGRTSIVIEMSVVEIDPSLW